jgi:predicted  nucleic acid-binding Zn-ribbon protein
MLQDIAPLHDDDATRFAERILDAARYTALLQALDCANQSEEILRHRARTAETALAKAADTIEELVLALKTARAVVAHHNPHGTANLEAIDRVLAKIGGDA